MSSDTVSVVLACWNVEEFVRGAIDSVLAQTHPAVEVVAVDDGSTDGTWEAIRGYGDRVRALRLPENRGAPHARNRGAEIATGAWLQFMDADDFSTPETLSALVEAGRGTPGAVAACPWEFLIHEGHAWRRHPLRRPFAPPGDPLRGWLEGMWAPSCAVLYPRALFERVGGFDETLRRNDDGDLAMRAFVSGAGIARATSGLGVYRRHGSTRVTLSSDRHSERALRSQMRVFDKLAEQLSAQGRLEEYRELLEMQYGAIALQAFEAGRAAIARECLARGGAGAARRVRSGTRLGRLATRVLGLERKVRLAAAVRRLRG
ncbi:MAG TPA: glycosyltransferase [Longimicrobium sp.]